MASKWKTFQPNEVLAAADVNDSLNPATADHIARAIAADTATATLATGQVATPAATVNLPAGRFTAAPLVVGTIQGAAGGIPGLSISILSKTATSFTFRIMAPAAHTSAVTIPINWIAVQL